MRYNSDLGISTIDNFDLAFVPVASWCAKRWFRISSLPQMIGPLTLTDAGMAELTGNWSAKADTSFANVTVGGTLAVLGDATFACNESLIIDGPAGTTRDIVGSTLGLLRWGVSLGTSGAESGSNAGSDFAIARYNDAGTFIDAPLGISRASGVVTIGAAPNPALALTRCFGERRARSNGQTNRIGTDGLSFSGTLGRERSGNVGTDFDLSRLSRCRRLSSTIRC